MFFVLYWPYNIGIIYKTLVCDSTQYALDYSVFGDEVWIFSSTRDYYDWVETKESCLIAGRFLVDYTGLYMLSRKDSIE
jgi:hypothetical protein